MENTNASREPIAFGEISWQIDREGLEPEPEVIETGKRRREEREGHASGRRVKVSHKEKTPPQPSATTKDRILALLDEAEEGTNQLYFRNEEDKESAKKSLAEAVTKLKSQKRDFTAPTKEGGRTLFEIIDWDHSTLNTPIPVNAPEFMGRAWEPNGYKFNVKGLNTAFDKRAFKQLVLTNVKREFERKFGTIKDMLIILQRLSVEIQIMSLVMSNDINNNKKFDSTTLNFDNCVTAGSRMRNKVKGHITLRRKEVLKSIDTFCFTVETRIKNLNRSGEEMATILKEEIRRILDSLWWFVNLDRTPNPSDFSNYCPTSQ